VRPLARLANLLASMRILTNTHTHTNQIRFNPLNACNNTFSRKKF
jgi:hypothetical protein